jgi:hypothetical protein
MGIQHFSDQQKGVTFIVWDGTVTWDDWREHVLRLAGDPAWKKTPLFIADLQSVADTSTINPELIDEITALLSGQPGAPGRKRNAVVAKDEFWRAKRFGELVERIGTTSVTFNALDTACIYLGLDLAETSQKLDAPRAKRTQPNNTL